MSDETYSYSVYLRLCVDKNTCTEYDNVFYNFLESYVVEHQTGSCRESFNSSDEGEELFVEQIKSFDLAKSIAITCASHWRTGVVEINIAIPDADSFNLLVKYSEPTIVGRTIPDLPIARSCIKVHKMCDEFVMYQEILFDLSNIKTVDDALKVKTKHIIYGSETPKKIIEKFNQVKPVWRFHTSNKD